MRGEVVSRDVLVAECWAGRVVGDDAISRCIARIRRLAETDDGFSVETIARVGYRLTENIRATAQKDTQLLRDAILDPDAGEAVGGEAQSVMPNHPLAAGSGRKKLKPLGLAVTAALLLAAMYFGNMQWLELNAKRELQTETLAEVVALVQKDQYGQAFTLALPLLKEERLKKQAAFAEAWRQIVLPMRPLVSEAGAAVYFKPYQDIDGEWLQAGVTPLAGLVAAPRGPLRIKVTKTGFRTGYFVVANPGPSVENDAPNPVIVRRNIAAVPLPLIADGSLSDDMVLVCGPQLLLQLLARDDLARLGDEESQYGKGLLREFDPGAVPAQLARTHVQLEGVEPHETHTALVRAGCGHSYSMSTLLSIPSVAGDTAAT